MEITIIWIIYGALFVIVSILMVFVIKADKEAYTLRQNTIANIESEEKRLKDYPFNHIEVICFKMYKENIDNILCQNPMHYRPVSPAIHLTSVTMYCKCFGIKKVIYPPDWKGVRVDERKLR